MTNRCQDRPSRTPDTVADSLESLADYLDFLDKYPERAVRPTPGEQTVNEDLRLLAAWFRDHPEHDADVMTIWNLRERR